MAKKTFAAARAEILGYLRSQGWKVQTRSVRHPWGPLKEPWAEPPLGRMRLTFKAQAVYADEHSTWIDIRNFDGPGFLAAVRRMYGAAADRRRRLSRRVRSRLR